MPSKPSFLHDRFTTQHSDFSSFLAVSTTDKPENRSIHAYAVTYLTVFALRGFIFHDFTKNKEGVRAIRAIKYRKYVPWKENTQIYKSNISVKRWHNKYENSELD